MEWGDTVDMVGVAVVGVDMAEVAAGGVKGGDGVEMEEFNTLTLLLTCYCW